MFRARDLPGADSLEAFQAALSSESPADARFVHEPAREVAQTPDGLFAGTNLFGPGRSPPMTTSPTSFAPTREVTSVLLHEAAVVPRSMTIIDRHGRVFRDGIDNIADPSRLADWGAPWVLDEQATLSLATHDPAPRLDCVALPVCGIGLPNFGHFLCDGLPLVLLHAQMLADMPWLVVGQALQPWQAEILHALGLGHRYLEVGVVTIFRCVLTSTLLSMHVSHPSRFVRPLFDLLRSRLGAPPAGGPRRVFLSRAGHDATRRLRNRPAIEAAMGMLGFAIIVPDRLSFAAQAAAMGQARIVVGESGAALANIGFCPPGAVVLELQPECFPDPWARGMCFQLAHRWHLYIARVDIPPGAPGAPFSYEIDPFDLLETVARIEMAA